MVRVEKRNNKLVVIIPNTYEQPLWLDNMYKYGHKEPKYIVEEDGTIIVECRDSVVSITKPIIQQTPMGTIQTTQTIRENWVYFDIPYKSILVEEGDDITNELDLTIKENNLKNDEKVIDNLNQV